MNAHKLLDKELRDIVEAIVKEANPKKIILFGSAVGGYIGEDSDLDLLVVSEDSEEVKKNRRKIISNIRSAIDEFTFPKDILLYSTDEVEYWKDSINHILANVLRDGKVLYERH